MKQQFTGGGYEPKCLSGFQYGLVLIASLDWPNPLVSSIVTLLKKTIRLYLFARHENGQSSIVSQLINMVDDKGSIS